MADIAELGYKVDTSGLLKAKREVESLDDSTEKLQKRTEKGFNSKPFDDIEKGSSRATKSVSGLSGAFSSIASLIPALSLSAMATSAINYGRTFDASMNNVQSKLGITEKAMQQLRDQARDLGSTTSFSATQASDAMGFLAQAGLDAEKIYAAMPSTLDFAAAATLDLAEAADISTNIMGGFKLSVADLPAINDLLTLTANKTNTSVQELAYGMKASGPVAEAFGMDMYEVAAALGTLANNGIKGEQGGTALRNMLARLVEPAGSTKKAMEELNLSMTDFFTISEDGQQTFKGLPNMIDKLSEANANGADYINLFGAETVAAASSLKGMGDAIRETEKQLKVQGAAADAAKIKSEGLDGAIKEMASAWEGLNITLMEKGGYDIAESGADAVSGALSFLNDHVEDVTGVLSTLWDVFGEAGVTLGAAGLAIAATVKAFGLMSGAFSALSALIVANPIGASLALLGTAAWLLYDNWEDVVGGAKALWSDLMSWFDNLMNKSASDWLEDGKNLSQGLTNGIIAGANKVKQAGAALGKAAIGGYEKETDTRSPSREMIKRGVYYGDGLSIGIAQGAGKVSGAAAKVADAAVKEFDRVIDGLDAQYLKLTKGDEAARRYELAGKNIVGTNQDMIVAYEDLIESIEDQQKAQKASEQALESAQYKHRLLTLELADNKDAVIELTTRNQYMRDGVLSITEAALNELTALEKTNKALEEQKKERDENRKAIESAEKAVNESTKSFELATKAIDLNDEELRALTLSYKDGYTPEMAAAQAANEAQTKALNTVREGTRALNDELYLHRIEMTEGSRAAAIAELEMEGYSRELATNSVLARENMEFQKDLYGAIYDSLSSATSVKDVFKSLGDWLKDWLKERIIHFATNKIMAFIGLDSSGFTSGLNSVTELLGGATSGAGSLASGASGLTSGMSSLASGALTAGGLVGGAAGLSGAYGFLTGTETGGLSGMGESMFTRMAMELGYTREEAGVIVAQLNQASYSGDNQAATQAMVDTARENAAAATSARYTDDNFSIKEALANRYATGGQYAGGLALVGEEGPELINFNQSGYVYTAQETAGILSSSGSKDTLSGLIDVIERMSKQQNQL
jgi:TP901 family phage tail tape measure protein